MAFILVHERVPEYAQAESAEAQERRVFVNTQWIVSVEPRSRGCRVDVASRSRWLCPVESAEEVLTLIAAADAEEAN